MGLLLSFLGGAAERLSESFEKDRDAMLEDIKESASFYRQAGMKRLEERREKEKTLRQRFETVKSLFNNTDYGDDIAAAAIRLSDDEFTKFRNTLQQNINQLEEGKTLDYTQLQKIGVLGKEFTPKEFSVDQAVNNVLGTFEGTTVGNGKNTVSTVAEGLRKHFGMLTPAERETAAMTKASEQLGISVPETQALFSGKGYTYGEGPTGVAFGITDPAARQQAQKARQDLEASALQLENARSEAGREKDKSVKKPRTWNGQSVGSMDHYEWNDFLDSKTKELAALKAENESDGTSYLSDPAMKFITRNLSEVVANFSEGLTYNALSGFQLQKQTDALANGLKALVPLISSKLTRGKFSLEERNRIVSETSQTPELVFKLVKEELDAGNKDILDLYNSNSELKKFLDSQWGVEPSQGSDNENSNDKEPPPTPPDPTKVIPDEEITYESINDRLAHLSRDVDFRNLGSLSTWLVNVKGQSDMRTHFGLSNSRIDTLVVKRVYDKIKANNIADPREVVEIYREELANK
jgi:hypothetical protein